MAPVLVVILPIVLAPHTIIQRVGVFDYFINRADAAAQGIELPQSLIDRAIDQTP